MKHKLYIGIDRSDQSIDTCILDASGKILAEQKVDTDPVKLTQWIQSVLELIHESSTKSIALCIEQPCQNLVHFFKRFEALTLYLINPLILKRYRETFNLSRSKDDKKDALNLAHLIHENHTKLSPWTPANKNYQKLAYLTQKRRQLIGDKITITNKLTQNLKEYYPQALKLIGHDIAISLSLNFLRKWPSLQKLLRSKPATIKKFYYLNHCRSTTAIERRMALISETVPLCEDAAVIEVHTVMTLAYVAQIQAIEKSIKELETMIEHTHKLCDKQEITNSLPGAGPQLAPRLTAFMGIHFTKWESAAAMQCQSGVAPVTKQSGKKHYVHRRYQCSTFWKQTFVEFAAQSVRYSPWARAFYFDQKAKGKKHQVILRSLAYKWQRIIYRCWKNNQIYNEDRYQKALKKSGSPLSRIINLEAQKKCA